VHPICGFIIGFIICPFRNYCSNRLASDLIRRGDTKLDRVMVLANRSVKLIVVLVAALKSGIAFSLGHTGQMDSPVTN
jgi:acyl-coenzyme A synthetase/AMP-(fatty) acid ligase